MAFAVALAVTLAATPLVARVARRVGVVDWPGSLKVHAAPVPLLGGVAILAGVAGPWAVSDPVLLAPLLPALLLGAVDDVRDVAPRIRLACEATIALGAGLLVPAPGPAGLLVTALLVVGLVNAVNLLDGLDGLATAVALVSALALAAFGAGAPALAAAGALAAFLVYNRPPARIFLGDGGAYLVGVALALLAVRGVEEGGVARWVGVPLLVAVPLTDTAVAILRRLRARRPLFSGDRSHIYDQLVDRGRSPQAAVAVLVVLQAVLAGAGLAGVALGSASAVALAGACVAGVAAATLRGGFLSTRDPVP